MKKWLNSLFSSKGTVSSKRVFGGIGFLICSTIAIYAVIERREIPTFISEYLYVSALLLGLGTVTSIFKKKDNGGESEE